MATKSIKLTLFIFIVFIIINVVLRLPTFFISTIDQDESLYILIADSLLHGHFLYTQIWDIKPPGIYLLFAAALSLFGHHVYSVRLLAILFSAGSSTLIYCLAKRFFHARAHGIGLSAGILFAIFSITSGGTAANTEHFFIFFDLFGMWVMTQTIKQKNFWLMWMAGFIFGIGIQIKYFAVLDMLAAMLYVFMFATSPRWRCVWMLILGSLVPWIITASIFYFTQHGALYYSILTASVMRATQAPFHFYVFFHKVAFEMQESLLLWLGAICSAILIFTQMKKSSERLMVVFCLLWTLINFSMLFATREYFPHYFLQIFPPLCLLSSFVIAHNWYPQKKFAIALLVILFCLKPIAMSLAASVQFVQARLIQHKAMWGDPTEQEARFIHQQLHSDDWFLVLNNQIILYFFCDRLPPTRYLFPTLFSNKSSLAKSMGMNGQAMLINLLNQQPRFIIIDPDWRRREILSATTQKMIAQNYQLISATDAADIYKRLN